MSPAATFTTSFSKDICQLFAIDSARGGDVMFTMSMDRFAYGLPDPQEAPVIAECAWCGREIYRGYVMDVYLNALPKSKDKRKRIAAPNSDYMHVECWEECADTFGLSKAERDLIATLEEL